MTGPPPSRPRPTPKELAQVSAWGGATIVAALIVSRGSIPGFVAALLLIGFLQRLVAYRIVRRRGTQPPKWWWMR
jgi:hypothetical protein